MIDEANHLCDRIARLVDEALAVTQDQSLLEKLHQLREIRGTIANLEKSGQPLQALYDLEQGLAAEVGQQEIASDSLAVVQGRLSEVFRKIAGARGHLRRQIEDTGVQDAYIPLTFGQEAIELPGLSMSRITRNVVAGRCVIDLTPKEFDLLWFLATNCNVVLTRDQLLSQVWGRPSESEGDIRTVDQHVKRLRGKLEANDSSCRISTVWGLGYKFEPGPNGHAESLPQ